MPTFSQVNNDLPTLDALLLAPIQPKEKLIILKRMLKHDWAKLHEGEKRLITALIEDYESITI